MIKTGSAWAGTFVCLDATGALAAGTPAGALYVDGTANAAEVTITGSNPYKWAVTLPALTAGQRVDMYITATIDTVETAGIVASAQADTFITSDIETLVDGIAGDVWSHATRTLTNQGVTATTPATGDPLVIYRDTTVSIAFTGLGNTASAAKVLFTVKENLEDADASSILQVLCTLGSPDTDTLLYVNKAAPTSADEGTFVFANHTDGTATVTVVPAAAADLPIYAAAPLYWDVKMISSDATPVVTILATGTMYIYGTPTRTIA